MFISLFLFSSAFSKEKTEKKKATAQCSQQPETNQIGFNGGTFRGKPFIPNSDLAAMCEGLAALGLLPFCAVFLERISNAARLEGLATSIFRKKEKTGNECFGKKEENYQLKKIR